MDPEITEKLDELKKYNYVIWLRSRGCGMTYLTNEYLKYMNDKTLTK